MAARNKAASINTVCSYSKSNEVNRPKSEKFGYLPCIDGAATEIGMVCEFFAMCMWMWVRVCVCVAPMCQNKYPLSVCDPISIPISYYIFVFILCEWVCASVRKKGGGGGGTNIDSIQLISISFGAQHTHMHNTHIDLCSVNINLWLHKN